MEVDLDRSQPKNEMYQNNQKCKNIKPFLKIKIYLDRSHPKSENKMATKNKMALKLLNFKILIHVLLADKYYTPHYR